MRHEYELTINGTMFRVWKSSEGFIEAREVLRPARASSCVVFLPPGIRTRDKLIELLTGLLADDH